MTIPLRVSALPADSLDRIRARGVDDFGNPLVVTVNREAGGTPLRCCLRGAAGPGGHRTGTAGSGGRSLADSRQVDNELVKEADAEVALSALADPS